MTRRARVGSLTPRQSNRRAAPKRSRASRGRRDHERRLNRVGDVVAVPRRQQTQAKRRRTAGNGGRHRQTTGNAGGGCRGARGGGWRARGVGDGRGGGLRSSSCAAVDGRAADRSLLLLLLFVCLSFVESAARARATIRSVLRHTTEARPPSRGDSQGRRPARVENERRPRVRSASPRGGGRASHPMIFFGFDSIRSARRERQLLEAVVDPRGREHRQLSVDAHRREA